MRFRVGDDEFDMLSESDLMWAESAALERTVGKTIAEIQAEGQFCGCKHLLTGHTHVDPDDPTSGFKCQTCGCENPTENLSIEVSQALMWISLKRVRPEVTFSQVGQMPMNAFSLVEAASDPSTGDVPQEQEPTDVPSVATSPLHVA